MLYPTVVRPTLFRFDSERVHGAAVAALSLAAPALRCLAPWLRTDDPALRTELAGIPLRQPVGLAAGFDKDGRLADVAASLGFGWHVLGTVTPRPQPGNDRPRMFRRVADEALVNRMGFNNPGVDVVAARLAVARRRWPQFPFGVSIGKNKDTPLDAATDDYRIAYRRIRALARFVEVNVSSPNTPGLRSLQTADFLGGVLDALRAEDAAAGDGLRPPILLKVAPDLDDAGLADVASLARAGRAQGVVATNTLPYDGPVDGGHAVGGLSGRPLRAVSLGQLKALRAACGPSVPLVSVGGVATGQDVWERVRAGATAVQVYTAFVYRGPRLPATIAVELGRALRRDGFDSVQQGIGAAEAPVSGRGGRIG